MSRSTNANNIETIQNEYRRIDSQWFQAHYRLLLGMAALSAAVELASFFLILEIHMLHEPVLPYLLEYLFLPLGGELLVAAAATAAVRSRMPDVRKSYVVSLLMAGLALLLYVIHASFPALYVVFTIPMALTVIYGRQLLTALTAALSVGGKVAADLVGYWSPERPNLMADPGSLGNFILSVLVLILFYLVCRFLITFEEKKNTVSLNLEEDRQRLLEESMTDTLTKVGNRQALREAFQQMEESPPDVPYFLAMMDLDNFKSLNDTYGHSQGDAYLRALGDALLSLSGERAEPFRFGGDEFCILFHGCLLQDVTSDCLKMKRHFSAAEIHQTCRPVTVSVGVAQYRYGERPAALLERADQALYRAKQNRGSIQSEI